MAWRKGLVTCLGFWSAITVMVTLSVNFATAQPLRSSVTMKRGNITLKVFLDEPRIRMGGIFLLKVQAVAPGDLHGDAVKFELPIFWADRVVQLSAITDRETFEQAGRIWTRITYSYRLAPLVLGRVKFDGLKVTVLKEHFSVPTIEGEVVSGVVKEPQQPVGPPVKVREKVNPEQAFFGQQVVYTLMFEALANVDFAQPPTYEQPKTEGFWSEDFPKIEHFYRSGYEVQVVRIALFPIRVGELKIGQAKVTVSLQGYPFREELQTRELRIKVKPLPEPKPEGFRDLVGQVFASTTVMPDTVGVGETLTVKLRVEGTANLKNLEQAPNLSLTDAIVGLPREQTSTFERDGNLWFVREFTWRIVPRKEGQLTIPSFRIPYFDPKEQRYKFATTSTINVKVLTGSIVPASVSTTVERRTFFPVLPIVGFSLLAVLVFGVFALRYWQQRRLLAAVPVSDPQLRQTVLKLQQQDLKAFGREVRNWLREQIYQRTGVLLSPNDTPERVQQLLAAKGISDAAARSIREVWELTNQPLALDEAISLLKNASELPQRL